MALSSSVSNSLLALIFNATNWANYADNTATSPQTQVAVSLNTADPTAAGNMSSSEATYTSYARTNVNRNSGGWAVSGNSCSPVANIDFTAGTGGSGTVAFFTVGKTGGGAAIFLFSGTVTPNITTGNGVTPRLTTATAITLS